MYRNLILHILAGLAGGITAYKKGRDKFIWAFACFIFPPLFFVLLILQPRFAEGINKRCPYCQKVISRGDTVCRYCRQVLPIDMVPCRKCGSFVPEKDYCIQCHKKLRD